MSRIGKVIRSLFSPSSAADDDRDDVCEKVSDTEDKERTQAFQVIKTIELKRLFLRPELTIADVASEMDMGADAVEHIFSRFVDGNFTRYLEELRIAYAALLFMGHESQLYSMEKIGVKCGFPDNAAFDDACRRLTGMTPEVMREFTRGRETLTGLFLNPPIYLTVISSDTLEEKLSNIKS